MAYFLHKTLMMINLKANNLVANRKKIQFQRLTPDEILEFGNKARNIIFISVRNQTKNYWSLKLSSEL